MEIMYPEYWRFIEMLSVEPENIFFDKKATPELENATTIATAAFKTISEELSEKFEDESYNWAAYKNTQIRHLGRIPAFTVKNVQSGGYGDAPNATRGGHGPSWRMVVAFGDEFKAYGVYPGGQSGNPGSYYYDNMIDQWANGEYNEIFFMKNAEDQNGDILFKVDFKN